MNNALITFAKPANEPVKAYKPGSPELGQISDEEDKGWNYGTRTPTSLRGTDGDEEWATHWRTQKEGSRNGISTKCPATG